MTLDDAIVAFRQVTSDDIDILELDVRDYERLVKWLTELKLARESAFSDIGLAARAVSENNQLKAENAKLRNLAVGMYGMLEMFDKMLGNHDACETPRPMIFGEDKSFRGVMHELGIEVMA